MPNIRGVSLCSQAMIVTPQYVRDASGSVLFPDRLLHKLHGRGLAKSTICWISLSLSFSSSYLFSISRLSIFSSLFQIQIKKHSHSQTVYKTTKQELLLVRTESSVKASRHVYFLLLLFFFCRAFVTRDL